MKAPLIAIAAITVLMSSVFLANHAFAASNTPDVKTIMSTYQKAIYKAQTDFKAAIDKANSDARAAISKGLPTKQINADSKAAMDKAKADFKAAKNLAQKEAKKSLDALKAAIKP